MSRAQYMRVGTTPEIVWIVDRNTGACSVTNDAEAVASEVNQLCPGRRIIYRDTDGNWDELVHENGVFKGFKPARDQPAPGWILSSPTARPRSCGSSRITWPSTVTRRPGRRSAPR